MQTRATINLCMAERVGFEPTNTVRCYTLSRRAPSTARPPLLAAQGYRSGLTRSNLAAGRLVGRRRLVARRNVVARVLGPRRRRHVGDRRNDQCAGGVRRIQSRRHSQGLGRQGVLILLLTVTVRG